MPHPLQRYTQLGGTALASGLLLSPGTGGDVSALNVERLRNPPAQYSQPFVRLYQIHQVDEARTVQPAVEVTFTLNPVADMDRIMNVFNSNISELAKMLHVSRQAIYKWKNGEGISDESAEKLHSLARAADFFVEAGLVVTPFMLRRTVVNGQSFLEIVEHGGSPVKAAQNLVQLVQIGQRQRALINQRLSTKQNRKTGSVIEEFPLPYEDD